MFHIEKHIMQMVESDFLPKSKLDPESVPIMVNYWMSEPFIVIKISHHIAFLHFLHWRWRFAFTNAGGGGGEMKKRNCVKNRVNALKLHLFGFLDNNC